MWDRKGMVKLSWCQRVVNSILGWEYCVSVRLSESRVSLAEELFHEKAGPLPTWPLLALASRVPSASVGCSWRLIFSEQG